MIHLDAAQIIPATMTFAMVMVRVSIFIMVVPILGSKFIPMRIKATLAMVLSVFITALIEPMTIQWDMLHIVLLILKEGAIGIMLGLILHAVFQIFILAGQLIAMQSGLGFATMVDPANGGHIPMVSQFYYYAVALLFFVTDGHLALINYLIMTFTEPGTLNTLTTISFNTVLMQTAKMFSQAVLIVLPAILALLVTNFAFAILTRIAPQLNIFAVGFPITLMLGLVLVWASLTVVAPVYIYNFQNTLSLVGAI